MSSRLRNACFVAALVVTASVGTMIACSPPPIGWQGAGRDQTLPEPQDVDSGSSSGGDEDSGSLSSSLDSGGGGGFDAGTPKDTGSPNDTGTSKDTGTVKDSATAKDAGTDAVDSAHPGNPGQFDGGPDAPANG